MIDIVNSPAEENIANKMFFNSDDDFFTFCVNPNLIVKTDNINGEDTYFTDWDFTDAYKKAVENGTRFIICDDNSVITKRGCISYKVNTKPIQNLDPFYLERL